MGAKRKPEEPKAGAPEYMLTYGDMMTLLLCFFVLLFSFSTIEKKDFQHVMSAFKDAIGVFPGATALEDATGKMNKTNIMIHYKKGTEKKAGGQTFEPTSKDSKFAADMMGALEKFQKQGDVNTLLREHGLILRVKGSLVFDQGSAHLRENMVEFLSRMAEVLDREEYRGRNVMVEGHTDNLIVKSLDYPSNWELSAHRAINVVRYLTEEERLHPVEAARIRAVGCSMYRPAFPNDPVKGNPDNRRVDIIVIPRSRFESDESKLTFEYKDGNFEKLGED
ncbi:MAG: hypothetical protein CVV64_06315 [Candidatus Wallbacteria bacterium HGW-Wallbacteria-1]|jgi:chemotaxis protein MotB|uniref:OmpA-like domain-containing protein n=1 Tax=Candidatus Wallbacteria bacterium HGW-Wallbacteria-1 TaxID=2013854 RepID=A0A2N1PSS3_9BACT|nr:MAG: hypothetical protein CVV64_06315 [Candidatus Wallbacteria bacterium HGW-Wallbacteria-1]